MLIAKNGFISHVSYNYRLLSYDLGLADHITHNKTIPSNSSLHTPGDMPFTFTHTWCHYNSFLHIPGDILFTFTVYTHLQGDILFTFTHTCCHKSKSSLHTPETFHSLLHTSGNISFTFAHTLCHYIYIYLMSLHPSIATLRHLISKIHLPTDIKPDSSIIFARWKHYIYLIKTLHFPFIKITFT